MSARIIKLLMLENAVEGDVFTDDPEGETIGDALAEIDGDKAFSTVIRLTTTISRVFLFDNVIMGKRVWSMTFG